MAEFPAELYYSKNHEWLRKESGETFTVGITDHAQEQLGDLVFVELPEMNIHVDAGDEVVVVESVKTAAEVYSPLSGKVIEINNALENEPAMVNHDPYGDGWLYRITIDDEKELNDLLDADDYQTLIEAES
ncbi:glycine cleavage system protein GcvH [Coxiella endosymbiont of Ornithodoros amblus]|uniref:glycine cleavage system protein GcvH n=1 Tax=Coxiella endosymbiont of Ornithodoros amblus TaxID=1656166 RepID=UPI00244E4EFB|nr:glycine cleavage system protein GcvH [Coxiella endosymbiont of Ornithodoros amblus]MBW5802494.1 glycine cleavage system protein GcvH [Coxiella endosymbiont of Ornithodoros amblus]